MPSLRFVRCRPITVATDGTRDPPPGRPGSVLPDKGGGFAGRLGEAMVTTIGGPRVLLRQLRETMAEPLASQDRLDKIVNLIADNMRAEVCSFYVLRDDGALELFATH